MNGPVSQSMREKGLAYKVNFGVELPRLREMAEEWPHNYELAAALWKENIRECRLLAGMLMQVDLALHNAKSDGRNTFRFFDPTMQEIVMVRAALERDIVLAQQNGQFLLHYQPQVT